ncbi:MAG: energy-coupling factor transporter transmembrane component T [Fidelibacterota bacterium]
MAARLNPLTWLAVLVTYLAAVFLSESRGQFAWLAGILGTGLLLERRAIASVVARVRPFVYFLPIMFGFYMAMTHLLTGDPMFAVISSVSVSALRIFIMIVTMSVFLEFTPSVSILDAIRTLWRRTGIRWRRAEDAFQLLYLTFRFFPMLKEEVEGMANVDEALGIPPARRKFDMIKRTVVYLPGLVANCLHRAENLGLAMDTRGYGRVLPRGVASPWHFCPSDAFVFALLVLFLAGFASLA